MKFRFSGILLLGAILCGTVGYAQDGKPHSAAFYYRVGEVWVGKQDWPAARKAFNECLHEDPGYVDAYYSRAIVFEHLDSLNKALTDYNIYLEFKPDHHEALFGRAQLRMRLNQNAMAKADFQRLLTLPPGETTAIFFRQDVYTGKVDQVFTAKGANKSYIYNALGQASVNLGELDEALVYFDSAVRLSPNDPEIFTSRGTAWQKKGDTAKAIRDYQRALMYDPHHALAKVNLSAISKGKKLPERDQALLDEAVEANPETPFVYAERAYRNFQDGNYKQALDDYNMAIKLEATPEYLLNRGLTKEKLNDTRGAYSDYTAAINIRNDFTKAWLNRGNLLVQLGKFNEAVDDYTVALTLSPEYGSAFFNRAMALNRLKKKDLACEDLRTAEKLGVKVDPNAWKSVCGN